MRGISGQIASGLGVLAMAVSIAPGAARAAKLTTLYAFNGLADGGTSAAGLTYVNGALYGTTEVGGAIDTQSCPDGCGTVFKVDPATGKESVVYAFTSDPDGSTPEAGLIYQNGYLYGTTSIGGLVQCTGGHVGCGTVFRVDPKTGVEKVIYSFTGTGTDGQFPMASLVYHGGTLFGTTSEGGTVAVGTVFAVNPGTGAETVLHSFTGGGDSGSPEAAVIYRNGALIGTTAGSEQTNGGTVFTVDALSGAESVLFRFSGATGVFPEAPVLFDHGAYFGTTSGGGPLLCCGTVFRLGAKSGTETVVYNFTSHGVDDGFQPMSGLIKVGSIFYGTTFDGGMANCFNGYGCGVIFKVDPTTGKETVLYRFTGGKDQGQPLGGLIYVNGAFYGTTAGENTNACENHDGCGTVFKFVP